MTFSEHETGQPAIAGAQTAVRDFLETVFPEVQRVDVTRVAPVRLGEAAWEAEADVWRPNATLKSLGLHTRRPVLDHQHYLLQLDGLLNVLAYELDESNAK